MSTDTAPTTGLIVLPPNSLELDSHGDIRNARAFASVARGRFMYVSTRDRWLKWDSARWTLCEKDEHVAEAKDVCGRLLAATTELFRQGHPDGKRLVQDAMAAHTLPRILAMLKLAVSEPGMTTTDRELDADPYQLGVRNGVIDLKTGRLLVNLPEFRITRYCEADYDPDATCEDWLKFLGEIFEQDSATIQCVQRLLGCTLLGLADEEILVICYGHGSNGKSVFSNVILRIMGDYAKTAPPTLLTARKQGDNGPRNDLAGLAGARYVSINEMQAGDRLDEQVVKMLAGREPISARFLHQEFFEFTPSFTPWLRTNHKPVVLGDDDGIWRRLVLLRFGRRFTEAERDPGLEGKLLAESNGILRWMVEGARLYIKDGIRMSNRMRSELRTYRTESDLLGEFLTDKTINAPAEKIRQKTLYFEYQQWCSGSGVRPLSKKSFSQRLSERGYAESKSGGERFYVGLSFASQVPVDAQGVMDRIEGIFGKSLYENSSEEKYPNSLTSCPTCPTTTPSEGAPL